MTDDDIRLRLEKANAAYQRGKTRLATLADQRRAVVREALDAGLPVADISRRSGVTREAVDRIREGITSGRDTAWRARRRSTTD